MAVSLNSISTNKLMQVVQARKQSLQQQLGKYATVKRKVDCPYCVDAKDYAGPFGVRELTRHKRICKLNPYKNKGPQGNKAALVRAARKEWRSSN